MKGLSLALALVLMAGCTSRAVRCDGKLTPINAPAAVIVTAEKIPAVEDATP